MTEQFKLVTNAKESKIFKSNLTTIKVKCSNNFPRRYSLVWKLPTQAWNKSKISPYTPLKTALPQRENHSTNNAFWLVESRDAHHLHKNRVQLLQDLFGTPTWPPFHCFGTPKWPPGRHVKTLYYFPRCMIVSLNCHPSLRLNPNGRQGERDPLRGGAKTRITFQTVIVVWEPAVNYASHLSLAIFSVNKLVFTLLFTWKSWLRNNYQIRFYQLSW